MSDQVDVGAANALVMRDVHTEFEGGLIRTLDGVMLCVRRGEWVAITGPSGCGKSSCCICSQPWTRRLPAPSRCPARM